MTQDSLPAEVAHLDCTHPYYCAETGTALPGWGPDGAFVDVSGMLTAHQRFTGPHYAGPGPYAPRYNPDYVAAAAMAEGVYSQTPDYGLFRARAVVSGPLKARLIELDKLTTAKNEGYAGADPVDPWSNYRGFVAFGRTALDSALARFNEKHNRAAVLYSKRGADRVGESLRTTLMDAAAIALIAVSLIDEDPAGCDCE
jgi:hypothetical protein